MPISPYAPVREHEAKSDPHPQYIKSSTLAVVRAELEMQVKRITKIIPQKINGNGGKGEKGDKGDQGIQGPPGDDGGSAPHTHPISDVVDLQSTLDGKAASSHTHTIANVTGLQAALDGKAALSHTHAQSDVTNLVTDLAGKAASVHTHAQADVTGLVAALAGKAATTHTHAQADVTNLVSDLAGKAASVHTHAQSDVTNLVSALAGKANSSHTHAQADVTNLVSDLAGKAATGHTHAGLPVMGRIAADIAQSSNTTFSNLFTQALLASEIWSFEAIIYFTSAAATTGLVVQCDSPTSPTFGQCAMNVEETVIASRYLPAAFNATMIGTAAVVTPAINVAWVSGTLENGSNAGNIVIKFRSEVNGSAITVKRGSWCKFFKH